MSIKSCTVRERNTGNKNEKRIRSYKKENYKDIERGSKGNRNKSTIETPLWTRLIR